MRGSCTVCEPVIIENAFVDSIHITRIILLYIKMLSLLTLVERHAFFETEGYFFVCYALFHMTRFFYPRFLFYSLFSFPFVVHLSFHKHLIVLVVLISPTFL